MIQTRLIQKLATGQVLFKDDAGEIIQTRIDSEPIGLTGELYPESITVGEGENAYSFVTPSNGGITLQPVTGLPTTFTGNAQALLAELTANFFTNTLGSGGGGGGSATLAEQEAQTEILADIYTAQGTTTDSPATNPNGAATEISLQKGIFANGFKSNIFELVIDPITGTLYLKSVVLDPNTPPIETKFYDPSTGAQLTSPTDPTYPIVSTLGVGNITDALETNPTNNASLIALSKGQLDKLVLTQEALGYGGSPTVLDPALGGTAIGVLKGLLSVAGLTVGQKIDLGLSPDVSIVHKSGKNFDVDTATLPESVWNGGGLYTGFPLTHTTTVQAVSSSAADVGTLTVIYLPTETSTDYVTATIPVNGTTPQTSSFNVYRIHSASYASTANIGTQLNIGTITVRSSANPLTVFLAMPIGGNQTYMSGYTIPKGKKGYIMSTKWRAGGTAGGQVEGVMFIRPKGGAPIYRRNCSLSVGGAVTDNYDGFIIAEEGTDIMPTIKLATANNLTAEASYDIIILPA